MRGAKISERDNAMEKLVKRFNEISIADVALVGGKNSSLGEMFMKLSSKGIRIPDGFATTAFAFRSFLDINKLNEPLKDLMNQLDKTNFSNLKQIGAKARQILIAAKMPDDLKRQLLTPLKNYTEIMKWKLL